MSGEPGALSFTTFVVSLARTAAVHLGDRADPATGTTGPPDALRPSPEP